MRQLKYTIIIGNSCASLHLWWKESLVKQQKVQKNYEKNCLQISLLFSVSLLTAPITKTQSSLGYNLLTTVIVKNNKI